MLRSNEDHLGRALQTEFRTARRAAASVSMVAPTSVAFFSPASLVAAQLKQRLQPLDLLLPLAAAVAVEGVAVVFLAPLPSSKCQTFHEFSCRYARTQNVQE